MKIPGKNPSNPHISFAKKKFEVKPVILQYTFSSSTAIMGVFTETKGKVTLIYKFIKMPPERVGSK